MKFHRLRIALIAAASIGLAGCATDDGYYGSGYYGGSYGASYGAPYYGWYDGYYYPGTGYYVYDRGGQRHSWNDGQRSYWEGRRDGRRETRENWRGYDRNLTPEQRQAWRAQREQSRQESRTQRQRGDDDNRGGTWWRGDRKRD